MSLFTFKSGNVEVTKELALLAPFQSILEKEDSDKYIAYIYHLLDWKSPYSTMDEVTKKTALIEDLFDGVEPVDEDLDKAMEFYKKLSTTDSLELLQAARQGVQQLRKYFSEFKIDDEDDKGRAAKDLMQNLKSVGAIIKSLNEWEQQIKQEKDETTIRRGVEIDRFNE